VNKSNKIYVAGHTGLIGSAILKKLIEKGHKNLIYFNRKDLDLMDKNATETMFRLYNPYYVFIAAANMGGIYTNNTKSGEHFYENIIIQTNIIEAARKSGVKKLIFLGSSYMYPKHAEQPFKEEQLMGDQLDLVTSSYSMAKLAGVEMCKSYRKQWGLNFISAILCNIYGENDKFLEDEFHTLPTFLYKLYKAKILDLPQVELWGDGSPKRELLYADDLADALYFLMDNYDSSIPINIGSGYDVPINFLAKMIKDIIGYKGDILWNNYKSNGVLTKLMDISKIKSLGWEPKIDLEKGIKKTYEWFLQKYNDK